MRREPVSASARISRRDTINDKRWFYNPGNGGNASGYSAIDKTKAARGSHSLHIHTEMNTKGSGSQVKARDPQPLLGNGFYLRAFMYMGQPIPDHHSNYFNVVAPGNDGGMFNLGSLDGKLGIVEFGPRNGDHAVTADPLIVGRNGFASSGRFIRQPARCASGSTRSTSCQLHVTDWPPSSVHRLFPRAHLVPGVVRYVGRRARVRSAAHRLPPLTSAEHPQESDTRPQRELPRGEAGQPDTEQPPYARAVPAAIHRLAPIGSAR